MSATPTVGQLVSKAVSLIAGLTDDQAKAFIKANNIRSNGKLETLVTEQLKDKTPEQLAEICAVQASPAKPEVAADKKPKAKPAPEVKAKEAKPEGANFERKGRAKRTTAVQAGPRGFRFGDVWTNSVKAADGIATLDIHRPKLIAHAESVGVTATVIATNDAKKICAAIATKLEKQAEQPAA